MADRLVEAATLGFLSDPSDVVLYYCTILINSSIGVTCDLMDEILVSSNAAGPHDIL
jgi:hypothetical protein